MTFPDREFDVVISSSVIEHVGGRDDQAAFAREVRRVGKAYYVQTPNLYFPVETHVHTPFFQFLSKKWQRRLVRNFTVRGLIERFPHSECDSLTYGINLLSRRDVAALFPDAEIIPEKAAGFTKSWIAFHRAIE